MAIGNHEQYALVRLVMEGVDLHLNINSFVLNLIEENIRINLHFLSFLDLEVAPIDGGSGGKNGIAKEKVSIH